MYILYYLSSNEFHYSKVLNFKPNETLINSIKKNNPDLSISLIKIL